MVLRKTGFCFVVLFMVFFECIVVVGEMISVEDDLTLQSTQCIYADEEVNLVTALVPSETACLASSPGRRRRTAVWISREERVLFLL